MSNHTAADGVNIRGGHDRPMECFDCGREIEDETATKVDVAGVVEMVVCGECHDEPDYAVYTPEADDASYLGDDEGLIEVDVDDEDDVRGVFSAHAAGEAGFVDVDVGDETVLQYHDGVFNVVDVGGDVEDRVKDMVEDGEVDLVPHDGRVEVGVSGSLEDDVELCRRLLDVTADASMEDAVMVTDDTPS